VGQAAAASAKLQGGVAHRVLRTALLQLVPIGSGAVFSSVLGARRPNSCSQGRASRPLCGGYAKSPAPICLRSTAARHEAVGGRWQHVLTAHLLLLNVNVAPRRPTDSSRPAATAEPCRIQPAASGALPRGTWNPIRRPSTRAHACLFSKFTYSCTGLIAHKWGLFLRTYAHSLEHIGGKVLSHSPNNGVGG
jgi:hypothetical protein